MSAGIAFEKPMRTWHAQKAYLKEHYREYDNVRFRHDDKAPPTTVETTSGPLVFTTSAIVSGLECRVPEALRNASVGNAIDELLTLRYSTGRVTDTAEGGRHRVRQRAFPLHVGEPWRRRSYEELEAKDEEWKNYLHMLGGVLEYIRADTIEDVHRRYGLGRHGMMLGLHAAVEREPGLCESPSHRHRYLVTARCSEMMDLADPDEITAVADLLDLATRALPAPSQLTRMVVHPKCGHGEADLLLDGTLIEVKAGGNFPPNTVLSAEVVRQLLGHVLSVPPRLEKKHPVTRAGWYLARFGVLWDFPIEEIPERLYGRPLTLEAAREAFRLGIPPSEVEVPRHGSPRRRD